MNIADFLSDGRILQIAADYGTIAAARKAAAFNLFTITSYQCKEENFHSDIIAALLNPSMLHGEDDLYVQLFISFLRDTYGARVNAGEFTKVIVTREKGRLDIWIRDELSRKAIIIENKINDAPDMEEQLDRYHSYSQYRMGYEVQAIVYLSLDGLKLAPKTVADIDHLVWNIGAYANDKKDLVHGWLQPCLEASRRQDSKSFIDQYISLIKHLSNNNMDNNLKEDLYSFLSEGDNLETLRSVTALYGTMSVYRANLFSKAVGKDHAPFSRMVYYKPHYILYDNYQMEDSICKLDVWFDDSGAASMCFWNTSLPVSEGRLPLTRKLESIGWDQRFDKEIGWGWNGYQKVFAIGDIYKNMKEVDEAILVFVKDFMMALR